MGRVGVLMKKFKAGGQRLYVGRFPCGGGGLVPVGIRAAVETAEQGAVADRAQERNAQGSRRQRAGEFGQADLQPVQAHLNARGGRLANRAARQRGAAGAKEMKEALGG